MSSFDDLLAELDKERQLTERYRSRSADLAQRLSRALYRTEYASWQLETARTTRWWQVRQLAKSLVRHPRSAPTELWRLVRGQRGPDRPTRVKGTTFLNDVVPPDLSFADAEMPSGPIVRPWLKVAVILDPFSALALRYEWQQIAFGPKDWREVFERERPDLLFCESAWNGNDGAWQYQMTGTNAPKTELRELLAYCHEQDIPTVFWNKEDPPNFDRFIDTAKLFHWVFTSDGDCIARYQEILGHDRVAVLQFAAQPRIHNPIAVVDQRAHDVVFAGMYFRDRHSERREQMETILAPARDFGLHIFSRFQGADERYNFPAEYEPHIVGSLPYEQMLTVYKMYKVFLNVNSVLDSPTMCARRVFELSACSTTVLSGYSRAIESTFGDLVPAATSPQETSALLQALLNSPELRERQAHLAMREVFSKHTFSHRVDQILSALGHEVPDRSISVSVILPTNRPAQIEHALAQVARQLYRPLQLVLVLHGVSMAPDVVADKARAAGLDSVVVLTADAALSLGAVLNLGLEAADGDLIAKMDDDNLYGPHYLSDLVHAFSYTDAGVVGKGAHYTHFESSGATVLRFPEFEHRYVNLVQGGSILARGDVIRSLRFADVSRSEDTTFLRRCRAEGIRIYGADRYSFVFTRGRLEGHTWQVDEIELTRNGRLAFYGPPEPHVII